MSAAIAAADSRGDGYVSVPKMKSIIDNCVLPVSEDHFKRSVKHEAWYISGTGLVSYIESSAQGKSKSYSSFLEDSLAFEL